MYVLCILVKCVLCIDKKREIDRGVGEVERYHVQPQQVRLEQSNLLLIDFLIKLRKNILRLALMDFMIGHSIDLPEITHRGIMPQLRG